MKEYNYPEKSEILSLQHGVLSYFILEDYATHTGDIDALSKLISDYVYEIPLYQLAQIISSVYWKMSPVKFQQLLDQLFTVR